MGIWFTIRENRNTNLVTIANYKRFANRPIELANITHHPSL